MTINFPYKSKGFNPFCELIGLDFIQVKKGYSQCTLKVDEKLFNPHKVLHGGVVYSMVDTGMGGAIYPLLDIKTETTATIEIKINYFKPVTSGTLFCNTNVIYKGKRTAVMESEVLNDDNLVAKAMGTYSILKLKTRSLDRK